MQAHARRKQRLALLQRVFTGIFPAGISYADRSREVNGDYVRLAFLSYEAVTRRRPNARVEARVHFFGLVMLLALIAVVSVFDVVDIRSN